MARKKVENTASPETTVKVSSSKRASGSPKPAAPRKPRATKNASPARPKAPAAPLAAELLRVTLPVVTWEMRRAMVAEAAYYIAERRGDGPGDPVQDWYEAEVEIEQMLEGTPAE